MGKLTFLELAIKVLEEEKKALSATQIWQIAESKGYASEVGSEGKTPANTLWAVLYRDEKKFDSPFIIIDERPKRFALKKLFEKGLIVEDIISEIESKFVHYNESDLHPFLAYYCNNYQKVLTKTIDHTKTPKKTYSQWLHPDMVGWWYEPIDDWREPVSNFSKSINNTPIKLFSFEIKKELDFSNIRESFFQAVSNSSWANEGYLVAAEIDEDEEFRTELRRLSSSFGIGVIKLEVSDPDSSQILYPAKLNTNLDWETINKLSINSDFADFLKRVRNDLSTSEIRFEQYDKIFDVEELIHKIQKK
ncbi:MAG: hypothetical protein HZR80_12535 [Candidatus Heimdallarchaeota archaeon]